VLALGDHVVRVAVQGSDDAVEYRLINQVWVSEDCEIVNMKFADAGDPEQHEESDPLEPVVEFLSPLPAAHRVM
jgi:SRSO17 transposase